MVIKLGRVKFGLENFIFDYVWIFFFGIKNKNWNYWGETSDIFLRCRFGTSQVKNLLKVLKDL